jgi:hypothetical protein
MWGFLVAGVAGALLANTRQPKTRITKSTVIGPITGEKWTVEYLEDLQNMVVIRGGTRVAFQRTPKGWQPFKASGHKPIVELIVKDFRA